MKKIIIIAVLSCLLLVISFLFVIVNLNYTKIKKENINLKQQIIGTNSNNVLEYENGVTLKEELDKLQKKLEKEISEYNLWIKTKEKLTSITSS